MQYYLENQIGKCFESGAKRIAESKCRLTNVYLASDHIGDFFLSHPLNIIPFALCTKSCNKNKPNWSSWNNKKCWTKAAHFVFGREKEHQFSKVVNLIFIRDRKRAFNNKPFSAKRIKFLFDFIVSINNTVKVNSNSFFVFVKLLKNAYFQRYSLPCFGWIDGKNW